MSQYKNKPETQKSKFIIISNMSVIKSKYFLIRHGPQLRAGHTCPSLGLLASRNKEVWLLSNKFT